MLLYHFTGRFNLPAILLSGLVRRTDSVVTPGPIDEDITAGNPPREVVHLTTDPDPEQQTWAKLADLSFANAPGYVNGQFDKRRIRMAITESRVVPWLPYARRQGAPEYWIDAMVRAGADDARWAHNWWITPYDIPRRKWRLIEDTTTGEVLWRRPMLHEYPAHWPEQAPYFFDFALPFDEAVERFLAATPHLADEPPELQVAVAKMTIQHWRDDYAVERTEAEWIDHLRTFVEAEGGRRPETPEQWAEFLASNPEHPMMMPHSDDTAFVSDEIENIARLSVRLKTEGP